MTQKKEKNVSVIANGVTIALLVAIVIGGFKAYNELAVIANKLQSIEKLANEKNFALNEKVNNYASNSTTRYDKLAERVLYLERKYKGD